MSTLLQMFPEDISVRGVLSSRSVLVDSQPLDLEASRKVYNHSTEFSWGFNGSGPAQLALAILLLYIPAPAALRYHQDLKRTLIAFLPEGSFSRIVPFRALMERVVFLVDGTGQAELFTEKL